MLSIDFDGKYFTKKNDENYYHVYTLDDDLLIKAVNLTLAQHTNNGKDMPTYSLAYTYGENCQTFGSDVLKNYVQLAGTNYLDEYTRVTPVQIEDFGALV